MLGTPTEVGIRSWPRPHIVLYLGVLAATAAVAAMARPPWRAAQRLALAGGAAVVVSAPLDEAWHVAFGRDAVLWSPPHMLAVVASLMLATGVLALATTLTGRIGTAARFLAAAAVIGALQAPVLEFDSDVPQFPVWTYLPVAVGGWLLGSVIIRRLLPGRGSLLGAAAVYTVLRVGIVALLAALDHSGTVVPPMLLLAALGEMLDRAGLAERARVGVEAMGATAIWFGWLQVVGGAATEVPASALPAAVAASVLAAVVVTALSGTLPRPSTLGTGAALALVAVLGVGVAGAPDAAAHDPGQGRDTRAATLTVDRVDESSVAVDLQVGSGGCDALAPRRTVARRAGETRVGALDSSGRCRYRGTVEAGDRGRWFVYVELTDDGRDVELWAPLGGDEATVTVRRPLYEPPASSARNLQAIGGIVLYALVIGMLRLTVGSATRIGVAGAPHPKRQPN